MTDGMELPVTPVQRARAGSAVHGEIVAHLEEGYGFFDIRTLGTGHWVVEVVTTTERDARAVARAISARWEVEADLRPGPLQDVIAWEGYVNVWPMDVPVRVVAVLDKRRLPQVTHHWEYPDDTVWRAQHPEVTDEQAAAAIDAVHRLELAGAW